MIDATFGFVRLRLAIQSDAERIRCWRNSDAVRLNMYNDGLISEECHAVWFEKMLASQTELLLIAEIGDRPVGIVSFTKIDRAQGKAVWAFYIGEADTPKGTGSMMEFIAVETAFTTLSLRKLSCEVIEFNNRVVAMHKQFGFIEEGFFVDEIQRRGKFWGVHRLALFADNWLARRDMTAAMLSDRYNN